MEIPVPVELWRPDQDWLKSTVIMVEQSEWTEAADVSELLKEKYIHKVIEMLLIHAAFLQVFYIIEGILQVVDADIIGFQSGKQRANVKAIEYSTRPAH